jgi:hypothetical protein
VRYGYRAAEYATSTTCTQKSRAQGFGDEVKRRILIGTYVLSHGYYDAYYLQAQRIRRLIANDFVEAFKLCDVIMGPTSPSTAFKLAKRPSDPVQMYLSDIYTIAVNLAGLPGMSIPCGFRIHRAADGLQLIGELLQRSPSAECGSPLSASSPTGTCSNPRVRLSTPIDAIHALIAVGWPHCLAACATVRAWHPRIRAAPPPFRHQPPR